MGKLTEIIERLEKATGPDRELDAEIFRAIGAPLPAKFLNRQINLEWNEFEKCFVMPIDGMRIRYEHPSYTSSIDTALTLVPDDHAWMVHTGKRYNGDSTPFAHVWPRSACSGSDAVHAVPAIALCIAALKARLALEAEAGGVE